MTANKTFERSGLRRLAGIFAVLAAFSSPVAAQISMPGVPGREPLPVQQSKPQAPTKNLLTLDELNALDVKFHKDMDAAQEAFDGEKFADAEKGFTQVATEVEDTIKRIATATLPKNGTMEIDGVKKPATVQNETEWFTRTLNRAQQRKTAAGILRNVADIQKQAADLLGAGKYPEDLNAYRKSADALTASRAQLDDTTFQFYMGRAQNGQAQCTTTYWSQVFRKLKDQYNRTTDGTMQPDEIRRTIQAVAEEIAAKGYLDAAKTPDMPEDARALFKTLADAARQYLSQQ